jgi:hypothetical protein
MIFIAKSSIMKGQEIAMESTRIHKKPTGSSNFARRGSSSSGSPSNRRVGLSIKLLLALLALTAVATLPTFPLNAAHAESLDNWTQTTTLPAGATTSCMVSAGYVYCVGGDGVYYASVSSSGVGSWAKTTGYPSPGGNGYEGCAIYAGYIYCVGGLPSGSSNHPTGAVYYATISSSGVGAWTPTTPYPTVIYGESCQVSSGYIYCLGGQVSVGVGETNATYYAPLSAFGVGAWKPTTGYPIADDRPMCAVSGIDIYCVGGYGYPTPGDTNVAFFATLSSSGIGAWTLTTNFPNNDPSACATSNGFIYCLGGTDLATRGQSSVVEYAPILPVGLGTWVATNSYPGSPVTTGCVTSGAFLYCVGGTGSTDTTTSVYFVGITSDAPPATPPKILLTLSSVAQNGSTISGYLTTVYNSDVNLSGFSPTLYTLNYTEHYMVYVSHYAGCNFVFWQDTGSTQAIRAISLTGNTTLTAVYNCTNKALNSNMTVTSVNQNGAPVSGYYVTLVAGPDVLDHAFTPTTFITSIGQSYLINASGFGNCLFLQWSDGVKANPRPFNATVAPQSLTAVYSCGTEKSTSIYVSAVNSAGANVTGYYITLWQNGVVLDSCFSTCTFNVVTGQYQVLADSFGPETFSHWMNDGSTGFETVDVKTTGTTIFLTAVYNP